MARMRKPDPGRIDHSLCIAFAAVTLSGAGPGRNDHVISLRNPARYRCASCRQAVRNVQDRPQALVPVTNDWVQWRLKDVRWVATARERLQSLSWFMKCLKEPLSRLANRQDQTRGTFFEGRFKSVAILDEESLLATCAYIDLNPVAAGIVQVPEMSPHTSIKTRVEHAAEQGRTCDLEAAAQGSVAGSRASVGLEESIWLCPIEDRRGLDSAREGMLARILAGQLPASGRLHGPDVPRRQGGHLG